MKISLLDGIKFRLWAVFHSCVIKRSCALNLTTLATKLFVTLFKLALEYWCFSFVSYHHNKHSRSLEIQGEAAAQYNVSLLTIDHWTVRLAASFRMLFWGSNFIDWFYPSSFIFFLTGFIQWIVKQLEALLLAAYNHEAGS